MFDENFSWDTRRSPSLESSNAPTTRDTSRSVSPCSPEGPFPPPRFTMSDLAAQLGDSRLRHDSRINYDSCEAYGATDDDAGWRIEPTIEETCTMALLDRSRTYPQKPARPHSPTQRAQRQSNARLLCTSAHQQELAALVLRMVQSQDQCLVAETYAPITIVAQDADEDDSSDGSTLAQSRRSSILPNDRRRLSDMKITGTRVNKSARFGRRERELSKVRVLEKTC